VTNESKDALKRLLAAIGTLENLGYTYLEGGDRWSPPLGKKPDFERKPFCDELADHLSKYECLVIGNTTVDMLRRDSAKWRRFLSLVDPEEAQ
jgi:hypothetical protein